MCYEGCSINNDGKYDIKSYLKPPMIDENYSMRTSYLYNSVSTITPEPIVEPIVEPVIEPVIEPIVEPVIEPIVEPIVKLIEPIVEPVVITVDDFYIENENIEVENEVIDNTVILTKQQQKDINKKAKELQADIDKKTKQLQKDIDKKAKELQAIKDKKDKDNQKVIDKENKILKGKQDIYDAEQNAILKIEEDKQKKHETDLINEDIMEDGFDVIDSNKKVSLIKIKRDLINSTSTHNLAVIIKDNQLYKPYFQCVVKINDNETRLNKLKMENTTVENIKKNIMNILTINETFYENNLIAKLVKTDIKNTLDSYCNYSYNIVINNCKIIPQRLKMLCGSSFFKCDIYETGYEYSFDFNDIFCNNIAFIKDEYDIVGVKNINYNDKYLSKKLLDNKIEKTEYYDRKALLYFYHNIDFYAEKLYNKTKKKNTLLQYIDLLKTKLLKINKLIEDTYFQKVVFLPNESNVNGRKISKTSSYQNLPREIRHTVGCKYYTDIDIKNAHFNLLLHLIKEYDLPKEKCNLLIDYATNREYYLDNIVLKYKKTKSQAKDAIIMLTYGGDIELDKCDWFEKFKEQVIYLQDYFSYHNDFKHFLILSKKEILAETETANKKDEEYTANLIGKTLSKILQSYENKCLEKVVEYLNNKSIEWSSLQFDGLQLVKYECYKQLGLKSKLKINPITNNLLTDISKYIKETIDIDISFHYKELDEGFILPNDYIYAYEIEYILDGYNENDISKIFIDANKHILNKTNDAIFFKEDNVWLDGNYCEEAVVNILKEMPIFYYNKENKIRIDRLHSSLNSIATLILKSNTIKTADFEDKLNNSTIGNISFNNGVYFFKTKQLLPYPQYDIVSTIKINRDYNPIRNEDDIKFLNNTFKSAFKDEDEDMWEANKALIARALAGHFTDKFFVIKQGLRITGKGVEIECMSNAFGGYCGVIKSTYFIEKSQVSNDENKDDAHMLFKKFKRYISISEFANVGKKKADGTKIKSFASGGDKQTARKLGGKDGGKGEEFRPHGIGFVYTNEGIRFSNNDAHENCIYLQYSYQFVDECFITDENRRYSKPILTFEGGLDLKQLVNLPNYIDAYTHLIIDAYKPHPFKITPKLLELREANKVLSSNKSAEAVLKKYFIFTDDTDDRISNRDVSKLYEKYKFDDDELKYTPYLTEIIKYLKLTTPFKASTRFKGRDSSNYEIDIILPGFQKIKLVEGITIDNQDLWKQDT